MTYVQSIEKALVYIEDNLYDDITLLSIAQEAGYSYYHFERIFKGIIGDSIKSYIRKRRITEAAKELKYTDISILDIAIKYGYKSRESFSRSFEREFGRNPSFVRRNGLLYSLREPMTRKSMLFEYERRKNGMKPVIKSIPARIVIGEKYRLKDDGSNYKEIPILWNKWNKEKRWEQIKDRKSNGEMLGICNSIGLKEFQYMIGCEVISYGHIPKNMEVYKIPSSLYAVFKNIGPVTESMQRTWNYIYTYWLEHTDYTHNGMDDVERYYCLDGEMDTDICIPIK